MTLYIKKRTIVFLLSALSFNTAFAYGEFASADVSTAATQQQQKTAENQAQQTTTPATTAQPTSHVFSALTPKRARIIFQLGAFDTSQGSAQNIHINGLTDRFTVKRNHDQNALLGIGYYYIDGQDEDRIRLMYGVNAFYLAHTTVKGNILQDRQFTNLAYSYSITNYPVYAAIKALFKTCWDRYTVTMDLGIGPNIIKTSNYVEKSLDGVTIPYHPYSGETNITFTGTFGLGIRFNNVICHMPLELGYRLFYLGQGQLAKQNRLLSHNLYTGNNFANALVFSISNQ